MKRLVKLSISVLVWCGDALHTALLRALGRKPRPTCVILYYHGVEAAKRADFGRQLDFVLRRTQPISAGQRFSLNGRQRYTAVTFDDGFVSVLENALPELERRDIPGTLFIPTGSVGSTPAWIKDPKLPGAKERIMSVEQLKAVGNHRLISIGSHSVSHPNFLKLNEARAALELKESKAGLEAMLGRPVTLFSFPHGACNERLVEMARGAGYERVFTIAPQPARAMDQGFIFGRVAVNPEDWALEFRLKVLGAYRWMARNPVGVAC